MSGTLDDEDGNVVPLAAAGRRRSAGAPAGGTPDAVFAPGGGGGHTPIMEVRVAVLEYQAKQTEAQLGRISDQLTRLDDKWTTKFDAVLVKIDGVATKTTVWSALGTGGAIGLTIVALFIAILAYLQDNLIARKAEPPVPSVTIPGAASPSAPPSPTAPMAGP